MQIYIKNDSSFYSMSQMSYLTIRHIAYNLLGDSPCAVAIATLFTKQNPEGVSSPQWWPGGLTETNARLHGLLRD